EPDTEICASILDSLNECLQFYGFDKKGNQWNERTAGTVKFPKNKVTSQDLAMALLFVIGYVGITIEESLAFNKSGIGLLMA
ncbi:hypothetical protein S83_055076, partial [Arachis hypogaea]